jgi:glycosyltransferase involved in cell wall biosynthesis
MIKVLHVAYSDIGGGAARAAFRIHKSLLSQKGKIEIQSSMRVINKVSQDSTVNGNRPKYESFLWRLLRPSLLIKYYKGFVLGKRTAFSVAWPKTGLGKEINNQSVDIIHLHWLGNDTLSIEEIGKIKQPIVWRLPDMWAFCGAEHYVSTITDSDKRYKNGYYSNNRPLNEKGKDLNRIVWERKMRAWKRPMHIICPTNWLADCVKESKLMQNWPVTVIPTSMDLERWQPRDIASSRLALGLPLEDKIILFGAMGGTADPRKGGDLLVDTLKHLKSTLKSTNNFNVQLVVFGQEAPIGENIFDFPVRYFGHLNDDISLNLLYSAADVMIVPSRQDNLPGTALESVTCGTPVVAFNIGGLPDIIVHKTNGWLSPPYDTKDMANGIEWIIEDGVRARELSKNARQIAIEKYNPELIANRYLEVYKKILSQNKNIKND